MAQVGPNYVGAGGSTAVSGTWSGLANAEGSTSSTYATWTSTTRSASATWQGATFGLSVPAGSTIDQVDVTVRHGESSTSVISSVTGQLYIGTTAVGTATTLTKSTTVTSQTFSLTSGVLDTDIPNLAVRVTSTRSNSTTSATQNIDWVTITVTYTPPPPTPVSDSDTATATESETVSLPGSGIQLGLDPAWVLGTATTITTAAFSPVAGSLLLVESQGDGTSTPTLSISDSVGLTWTAIGTIQRGANGGYVHAWWAYTSTARTNMTASVNWGNAVNKTIKVTTYTGTASASAVISKAQSSTSVTDLTVNVTNTNDGARIAGSAIDWNARGAPTSADDEVSYHIGGFISGTSVRKAANTSGTGQTVGLNFVAATASPDWGYKVYEIVPGAGGGATPVSGADTGTGTEGTPALAVTLTPPTDARTSSEGSPPALSATQTASDALGGVEAYQLAVTLVQTDTAGGAESGSTTTGGSQSSTDTGTGTEAITALSRQVAETGSGTDAATMTVTFTATDAGALADVVTTLARQVQTDAGSGTDTMAALNAGGNQSSADTSTANETVTLLATVPTQADTMTAVEDGSIAITLTKTGSDTGSATDLATLTAALSTADIIAAVEVVIALTGPQFWTFIGADIRTVTLREGDSAVAAGTTEIKVAVDYGTEGTTSTSTISF